MKTKKEKMVEKLICAVCVLSSAIALIVCIMQTIKLEEIHGWNWQTIIWTITIPMFIWIGKIWGKMLFSKK